MTIDFSKLSPATRYKILSKIKDIVSAEYGRMGYELSFWENKNSDAYKEMVEWREACREIIHKISNK